MSDDIEQRLSRLRPAALPPGLMGACRSARSTAAPVKSSLRWWLNGLAAAILISGLIAYSLHRPATPGRPSVAHIPVQQMGRVYTPVESLNHLLEVDEVGIVFPEPDRPCRLVRCVWLDDNTYHERTGASTLRMTQSREQFVPVPLEIY